MLVFEKKVTRRQENLNSWGEDSLGSRIEEYSEVGEESNSK